jgi:MATE family multidrug resistance protein
MACSALALLTFSRPLLSVFTQDEGVIQVAQRILLIAALFQLSDGTQTVTTGALRGLADTRSAMIANLLGHWLIGLPIGLLLCFVMGWGLVGIWTGLSLGLTTVAAGLLWSWRRQSLRKMREMQPVLA